MKILSLDPSFTATGYAVLVDRGPYNLSLVTYGWIQTRKDKNMQVTLDDMCRAQSIADALDQLVRANHITHLYSEVPLGTISAISAKGLSIAKGVVASIAQVHGLNAVYLNPFRVKKALCGNNNAEKKEIVAVVESKFPELIVLKRRLGRTGKFSAEHEAICDAIAVTLAVRKRSSDKTTIN